MSDVIEKTQKSLEELTEEAHDKIDVYRFQVNELYDEAESFSARVKLWLTLNTRKVAILVISHFAAMCLGVLILALLV